MSKTAVIYYSAHHGNTRKVLEAVKDKYDIDLFELKDIGNFKAEEYEYIGLASGIYFSKMNKGLYNYVEQHSNKFSGKKVFTMATYGGSAGKGLKEFNVLLSSKNINTVGAFSCPGYDTYGIFKIIGGIRKNHPNNKDFEKALEFCENIGL